MYEAMKMPRAWVVYDSDSKEVVADYPAQQEAEAEAQRLNVGDWLEARPDSSEAIEWGADSAWPRLEAILDKIDSTQYAVAA